MFSALSSRQSARLQRKCQRTTRRFSGLQWSQWRLLSPSAREKETSSADDSPSLQTSLRSSASMRSFSPGRSGSPRPRRGRRRALPRRVIHARGGFGGRWILVPPATSSNPAPRPDHAEDSRPPVRVMTRGRTLSEHSRSRRSCALSQLATRSDCHFRTASRESRLLE